MKTKNAEEITLEDIRKAVDLLHDIGKNCKHDFENTTGFCEYCGKLWVGKEQMKILKEMYE